MRHGVDYFVTCGSHIFVGVTPDEEAASLSTRLAAGDVPGWLDKLPDQKGDVFTVYRVRR